MDDVEIEDVDEGGAPLPADKAPPKNQDLDVFRHFVAEFLSQHGWYVLLFITLLYLLVQQMSKRRSRQSSPTQTEQDASLVTRRQEAMEAARRKMQDDLDLKAGVFKEKLKKQEEEKRREKIDLWDSMQQGQSYKEHTKLAQTAEGSSSSTTVLKPKTHKKPLRSADYNPLSGQGGGSCSWRPGARGPSSGG